MNEDRRSFIKKLGLGAVAGLFASKVVGFEKAPESPVEAEEASTPTEGTRDHLRRETDGIPDRDWCSMPSSSCSGPPAPKIIQVTDACIPRWPSDGSLKVNNDQIEEGLRFFWKSQLKRKS